MRDRGLSLPVACRLFNVVAPKINNEDAQKHDNVELCTALTSSLDDMLPPEQIVSQSHHRLELGQAQRERQPPPDQRLNLMMIAHRGDSNCN